MKSQSILVLAIVVLFVIAAWACELAFVAYIVGWGGNWYSQADVPAGNDFLAVAGAGGQPDSDALVLSRRPWALGGPDRVVIVGQPVSFYGQAGSEDEEIVEYAWDFESDTAGSAPAGWKVETTNPRGPDATWNIMADSDAPSGRKVLALTSPNHDFGGAYNLCWRDDIRFKNGTLEATVRANTGDEDQGGGPIWRVQDKKSASTL